MRYISKKTILVWRFEDAPKEYKNLSPHGGDEDWIACVPDGFPVDYIPWLQSGTTFGCCEVTEHKVEGGTIYIGAHA